MASFLHRHLTLIQLKRSAQQSQSLSTEFLKKSLLLPDYGRKSHRAITGVFISTLGQPIRKYFVAMLCKDGLWMKLNSFNR